MAARSIASPPQGTANSAPVLPRCRLLCRRPPGARTGSSGRALIRRASLRTQGGQLPLPLRTFRAPLALSQKQVFSAVLPLFPRCARGSTKRKRSLLQIVALLCRGARAMPCGPAPALSAPAGGRRGVLLRLPASHPCGLCGRAALRAALHHRRPIGAPCRRSARAFIARRPAARLVALPSAPPASVLSASPPRGFCPSMMGSRPVSSRVWGCSASFRASARCARSRSGLVPGA